MEHARSACLNQGRGAAKARGAAVPVAVGVIAVLTLSAWSVLFLEAWRRGATQGALLEILCRPAILSSTSTLPDMMGAGLASVGLWIAMSVAMMLPTASAMVLGYADEVDQAGAVRDPHIAPAAVIAGYLTVWAAAAALAAVVQTALATVLASAAPPEAWLRAAAGGTVVMAGLYQFASIKGRMLAACAAPSHEPGRPLPSNPPGAFGLGLSQGWRCVACCWALMLALAVLGVMNLVWMAAFAIMMTAEKTLASQTISRAIGAGLVVCGLSLLVDAGWMRAG